MPPLSLSMLKMEKNFVAVIDKNYPRKPYEEYPIFIRGEAERSLIGFVWREMIELNKAIDPFGTNEGTRKEISERCIAAMSEVADVSNTLEYLFEGLLRAYMTLEDEIE